MKPIKSVDNISNKVLDELVKLYGNNESFFIHDDRKPRSLGKKYFLIRNKCVSSDIKVEFTFIWIGNNLWQFTYCNVECVTEANWKNPLDLLNELLNPTS